MIPFLRLPSLLCRLCLTLLVCASLFPPVQAGASEPSGRRQAEATYQDTTLTEDVTWRGTVLVKGFVVVAPQATLRIEPGTVVRFTAGSGSRQLPRIVVMGRIHAVGTAERPIQLVSAQGKGSKGSWGGVRLLSSEKRNQLEHCRIDGAETGIEARFSTLNTKGVAIANCTSGLVLRDSTAGLAGLNVTACDTGIEVHDSEAEFKDGSVLENRTGMVLTHSSIVMVSMAVKGNLQHGLISEECRLRVSSCEVAGNAVGARITGGEGQLFMSRFTGNRDTALHLATARLKITRCRITDNARDGMHMEDGRAAVWGNDISGNGGFNLVYTGRESASVMRNWWGTADESSLMARIKDGAATGQRSAAPAVYPWLAEKPTALP